MKKYLTKWVFTLDPSKPLTRANSTYTFVNLVRPKKSDGTISFERMMVADEAWVRQNMGDIDLDGMELPEFFTTELFGSEKLSEEKLSEEDKAVADKATKLIARDYGEVIKKLEDE